MAGATPKNGNRQPQPRPHHSSPGTPLVVHPRWILSAFAGVVLFGLLCAYATLCGLFYYGQWQLVLRPSREVSATPSSLGLPFTEVRFADDATGQPQLFGWWIPGQPSASVTSPTALLLHDGTGSVSSALPDAQLLHNAGLNILLFDYRGFGRSAGAHPTEATMEADARSALAYLTDTRSYSPASVVVYGRGLGGSLATLLCTEHPSIPTMILNAPEGDVATRVEREDSRVRMIPASLLFNQPFPLADRLHTLHTPKLLITWSRDSAPLDLQRAADPKTTLEIDPSDSQALPKALRRFLDTYVPPPPGQLTPQSQSNPDP